jgi:hypothetical protein
MINILSWLLVASFCVGAMAACPTGLTTSAGKSIFGVVASGGGSNLKVGPGSDKCFYTSGTVSPTPPSATLGDLFFSVAATNTFDSYFVVMGTIPGDKIQTDCAGFSESYSTTCSGTGVCGGSMNYGDGNLNPIPNARRPAIRIFCRNSAIVGNCDFTASSNLNVCWDVTPPAAPTTASTAAPTAAPVVLPSVQALPLDATGGDGYFNTATVTFCTTAASAVYISGDSTASGTLSVDDMLVYQLDSNPVVGLSFSGTCSASGFLAISSGSVVTAGSKTSGPAFSLGTLAAGTHTLKIGIYNCLLGSKNGLINIVGSAVVTCPTSGGGGGGSSSSGGGGGATANAGGNVCFHHSTVIEYQGQRYTMQELQATTVPGCRVPHTVTSSDGVVIETTCSSTSHLHLTGDHLVYVAGAGLKAAHKVAVGNVLFADMQQTKRCKVTKVSKRATEDTYFGLNCLRSDVLANGIKTSTFGHYHAVPAAWMKYAGHWFGIERASRWGNSLANVWHGQQ